MVFVVPKYDIMYAPVPKAACTSLKRAMYALEHGEEFKGIMKNGKNWGIQVAYPSEKFDAGDFAQLNDPWKIAVIRDPASRVLSTWSNRVIEKERLVEFNHRIEARRGTGVRGAVKRALGRAGDSRMLDPKPDVNQFILNLDDYVSIYPPIEHHLESVSYFLGDDLSIYDRIYTMKEISQLEADVRERTGRADFSVPKRNSSPNEIKVTLDDLSDAAFEKLISWLEPEYELLSQWFTPPRRDPQKLQQTGTI